MKKIFKTVTFLLASAYAFAQAPQSFNYQGLARDNAGAAMATKTISVKATILDGTATGTSVYSETFSPSTNAFGLFTLGIGSGTPVAGTFSAIKWSTGNKFLKIEVDPNGGSSYALSGTTQLLSVPYAMYAASAGDSKAPKLTVSTNGDTLYSGEKSNWVIIPGISAVNNTTVKDLEGNSYNIVNIGTQTWMSENLKVTKYSNGDVISTDLWANPNGNAANKADYGLLYKWETTQDTRGVCPTGWHVPSDAEWSTLDNYIGGLSLAGGKLKTTGTNYWLSQNLGATNEIGFNSKGAGDVQGDGTISFFKERAYYWTSTIVDPYWAYFRWHDYTFSTAIRNYYDIKGKMSIRCIKN